MFNQLMMATNGWYSVHTSDEDHDPTKDETSKKVNIFLQNNLSIF